MAPGGRGGGLHSVHFTHLRNGTYQQLDMTLVHFLLSVVSLLERVQWSLTLFPLSHSLELLYLSVTLQNIQQSNGCINIACITFITVAHFLKRWLWLWLSGFAGAVQHVGMIRCFYINRTEQNKLLKNQLVSRHAHASWGYKALARCPAVVCMSAQNCQI